VTSVPPPFRHPGSPPSRPELPEGVVRDGSIGPPSAEPPRRDELPRWPVWTPFAAMLTTVVIALVGVTVVALAVSLFGVDVTDDDTPPGVTIAGTLVQDLALIFSALLFARITDGQPTARQFGLRPTQLKSAAGWTVLCWVMFFVFSAVWAAALGITESDDLPQELGADDSTLALIAVAVLVCVIAPITEEFFFRGFCFTVLRRWIGLIPGALATGAIFGLIHWGSADAEFLPPLAFFGFVLCLLYHWTGSLLPCIVLHGLNNSLALGVSQEWPAFGVVALMAASIGAVVGISLPVSRSPRFNPPRAAAAAS
jgi:membrane protease YdiL (CAAX protease family)